MWWKMSRRHDAVAGRTVQVHPHRRRHLHLDALVDEGFEQVAAHAHGERAEGAHLRHMTVEMDHKGAGCRIPQLRGDVVTDAQALVHRHAVLLAPVPGVLVQVFFLGRDGRNHVVDKERKAFRFGHLVDTEVLFHLLEDDIGVAGKVVGDHEVGPGADLIARCNRGEARCPSQNFFGDGRTHARTFWNPASE